MSENTTRFAKYYAYTAIVLFCLICLVFIKFLGQSVSVLNIASYISYTLTISGIIMFAYTKKLWNYDRFVKMPRLKKEYTGIIHSTYDGEKRSVSISVSQTLLATKIVFVSQESKSVSVSASFVENNGNWQLLYHYFNTPDATVREESPMHYGTVLLDINNEEELKGSYYTDRKTTGTIILNKDE